MASDYNSVAASWAGAAAQADNSFRQPTPYDAPAPTIFDKVDTVSKNRHANAVADSWRKATEVANQTATQPPLPEVDGYSLVQMSITGSGLDSASQIDRDFIQLGTDGFRAKYGDAVGQHYEAAFQSGAAGRRLDLTTQRSGAQIAGDTVNTVLSTPVSLLGGIAALGMGGAGYVSQKLGAKTVGDALTTGGTKTSELVGDFTRGAQSLQSDQLNAARKAFSAETSLQARDNAAQAEIDTKRFGSVAATGLQIAKDTIGSFGALSGNSAVGLDTVANAAGSLLGGGVLTKGFRAIGGRVAAAAGDSAMAQRAIRLGQRAEMPASMVSMEAGSAYQQTVEQSLQSLAGRTDLTDAQKQDMANKAGLEAASIQAAATAAPMMIPGLNRVFNSNFERSPIRIHSFGKALREVGAETLEEGYQEGSAQLAQNKALQDQIDPNQKLADQVGTNIALGAIGGLGSAAAFQGPGVAANVPVAAVKTATALARDFLGRNTPSNSPQGSPVSDAAPQVDTSAPEAPVASPAPVSARTDATKGDIHVESMVDTSYDGDHRVVRVRDPKTGDVVSMGNIALDAYGNMGPVTLFDNKTQEPLNLSRGDAEHIRALASKAPDMSHLDGVEVIKPEDAQRIETINPDAKVESVPGGLAALNQGALDTLRANGTDIVATVNPETKAPEMAVINPSMVAPTTDANHPSTKAAAEGLPDFTPKALADTLNAAETAPETVNPDQADKLLFHADDGKVNLSPAQRTTLRSASAVARGVQTASAKASKDFGLTNSDQVSKEILTNGPKDGSQLGKKSVMEHLSDFREAIKTGDTDAAKATLTELGFFAEHMANKVDALNRAVTDGNTSSANPARYQSYVGNGKFRVSGKIVQDAGGNNVRQATGVHVSLKSANSVALAQRIATEANTVYEVVNNLVTAFPELGSNPVVPAALNAALIGDTKQIVEKAISPVATSTQEAVPQTTEQTAASVNEADTSEPVVTDKAPAEAAPIEVPVDNAVAVEPAVDVVEERSLKNLFPALVGSTDNVNRIQSAFELPAEAATRTEGVEQPLQAVGDALLDRGAFENFIDGKLNRDFSSSVAAAYAQYFKVGSVLLDAMNDSLGAFLSKNEGSKHSLVSGTSWINGQALNIVEEHEGQYRYNPALVQGAVLAGLNWYLKLSQKTGNLDEAGVRQLLKLSSDAVLPSGLVNQINNYGVGNAELSRSLAREIQKFWGLNQNPTTPRNHAEGLLEAVAKELLVAMTSPIFTITGKDGNDVESGLFQVNEVNIADVTTNEKIDHLNRYSLTMDEIGDDGSIKKGKRILSPEALKAFPNAIETAVLINPEQVTFVGEAPKTVAKTQLRNSAVSVSAKQTKAIETQQNVPHLMNMPYIDTLIDMGEDMVLRLFGGGKLDPKRLNAQHMLSLKGRNLTIQSAYRSIRGMLAEAQAVSDNNPAGVPVYFAYDTTVVNRQQMMGRDNPQSNKLMREAVLPTWHTLDLTDPKMNELFQLGLAQALGIKVHTQSREKSLEELATKLAGFTGTLKILNDKSKLRFNEQAIDTMKAEGIDSPVALHAVMEWNRSQNAQDTKAFRTATYFEADGVTNGVVNAMALFSSGSFTGKWLSNIARGGYWVGEQLKSLADLRGDFTEGQEDLYGLAGTATTQKIRKLRSDYIQDGSVSKQFDAVRDLLSEFLKDVNVNEDGLEIKRGAVKNPLTITIYGSGANGIAGNVVDEVLGKFYEMMSEAAARKEADPSITEAQTLYGGDEASAQIKFDRLVENLNRLTGTVLTSNKGVLYADVIKSGKSGTFGDPVLFKFPTEAIKTMRQNVLHAYVNPMVEGITETVGSDLMQTLHVLKTQVQAWSLIGRAAYRQAYAKALAAKGFKSKNDILSIKEEGAVLKSVMDMLPKFDAGDMSFLFGMTQRTEGNTEFGHDFKQKFETSAWGYTPGNAGVAGIPGMTIGSGDGQAVLNAVNDPEMPEGFLQIFDGIHSSVAEMEQMGRVANRAVFNSWQNNPMAKLAQAFSQFVSGLDLGSLDLNEDDRKELTKSLFSDWFSVPSRSDADLKNAFEHFAKTGTEMGQAIAERQAVMARVQSSVDQMAGAASPHQNTGLVLSGSAEQKAAQLEIMRSQVPEAQTREDQVPATPEAETSPVLEVPKLSFKAASVPLLGKLLEKQITKITKDRQTRALLRDVIRSGAVEDFTVHVGTREELISKAAQMGITVPASRSGFMGFMDPSSQSIFVVDGNPETMLHELIHAGTYQKLQAFFDGSDTSPELAQAVQRLQGLMAQFKAESLSVDAYQAALDEMERQASVGNQAGELNEFMAWALANADLAQQLKATKVNPALKLARSVVQAIKALIFGGKRSFAVKDDMFTNLRFNTNIILRSGNPAGTMTNVLLFQDPGFGESKRASDLLAKIKTKISDYVNVDPVREQVRNADVRSSLAPGSTVSQAFQAAGFRMTAQEHMAFLHTVAIMSTNAKLDPNSTARLQEMFAHVGQHLTVDDFLRKPEENDPNDIEQATKKINVIMGRFKDKKDNYGRSLVLPAFVALAATNEEFREILKKVPMPKTKYVGWDSVDNILDNLGDAGVDNVSRWVSGEGLRTADSQAAIDNLVEQMLQTNADSQLFIEKFTNPIGDGTDRVNQAVVDGVKWLIAQSDKNLTNFREANPDSRVMVRVLEALNVSVKMLNEEEGRAAATKLMGTINGSKLSEPVFNLLKDMIGRTEENGKIFDMIKIARTWVNGIRQQFREQLPKIVNSKFSRTLTDAEQTHLHQGLGQTGLASLLSSMNIEQVLDVLGKQASRDVAIKKLVDKINELSPNNGKLIETKANELAGFMISKKTQSTNLLRNATAIAHLLNEAVTDVNTSAEMIEAIDHLVSLLAVNQLSSDTQTSLADLAQTESKGLNFMLSYLRGQDELDKPKLTGNAKFNHWKGYMPSDRAAGVSLNILHNNGADNLLQRGYVKLSDFVGSSRDPSAKDRGYYFLSISGNAPFAQGIMQNVHQTASGVDKATGFSLDMTAGEITEPALVLKISKSTKAETGFGLLPVYDQNGTLFAYERAVDPALVQAHLKPSTNMAEMMGVRSGRQSEEGSANQLNRTLIDALHTMYDKDRKAGKSNQYINLSQTNDKIHRDAMRIFSKETKDYIDARFPEGFWVRRDMVDDAIGYRQASIGDVFTGNSRWSPEVQALVRNSLVKMFGTKAYRYAIKAESVVQNFVMDARVILVVKSIIVPMANAASNVMQLIGRGVPAPHIFRAIPKKIAEIESWHKTRIRQIEAEAELLATDSILDRKRLEAEIQTIKDSHKRLSIWPLLEAGEFSHISDAGSREDIALSEGRLGEYIEKAVSKLPKSVQTAGRYYMLSKDTALFRALQKSVAYGDFVAKAVLYDDLTQRKGQTTEQALKQITEEFVNYDRLPGRDRAYLENIGLLWFYNFKIRSAKVALSMIRNNPVHSLMAMAMPMPIRGTGLPLTDNLWYSLFENKLGWSTGLGMAVRAPGLLPVHQFIW